MQMAFSARAVVSQGAESDPVLVYSRSYGLSKRP